jgi:hypothetical protein
VVRHPPGARGDVTGAPLIVTAELPGEIQAWAERLRQAHYPREKNRVPAHVSLFRALPPSCEGELGGALAAAARDNAPVPARLGGPMTLGTGTALTIHSPAMLTLRGDLAWRFQGLLTPQDEAEPRLHITVQNKVAESEARALQAELERTAEPRDFRFAALALHRYLGGPWETVKRWSFRG